jgi:DNA-binding NarL/FixJ family response regulator
MLTPLPGERETAVRRLYTSAHDKVPRTASLHIVVDPRQIAAPRARIEKVLHAGAARGFSEPTRVVVVDDDLLLLEALALAWEREADLAIVGIAGTAAIGIETARRQHPEVVLMDHHLPDMSGSEATIALRAALPEVAVVIMTIDPTDAALLAAIEAGANGFIAKTDGIRSVAAAVRRASTGEMLIEASTVARLLAVARDRERQQTGQVAALIQPLTGREAEVLHLMAQGLDTRGLADRLALSQTTVRTHVAAILAKLDAHSRLEAVVKAAQLGLLRAENG